jgi:hypothetical protein
MLPLSAHIIDRVRHTTIDFGYALVVEIPDHANACSYVQ